MTTLMTHPSMWWDNEAGWDHRSSWGGITEAGGGTWGQPESPRDLGWVGLQEELPRQSRASKAALGTLRQPEEY